VVNLIFCIFVSVSRCTPKKQNR